VRNARTFERADGLKRYIGADVVQEAFAAAEQKRNDVKLHLVDQTRREVLLGGFGSSAERDRMVEFGALEGGKQTLERLAEHLTKK